MLNYTVFMGRLTADPEVRTTPNGNNVCNFSIAVQRPYVKGAETQADFFNCVAWKGNADAIAKFFKKGNRIIVSGSMQTRRSVNEESGTSRTFTELVVNHWEFVDYKSDGNTENNISNVTAINNTYSAPNTDVLPEDDDDLPF